MPLDFLVEFLDDGRDGIRETTENGQFLDVIPLMTTEIVSFVPALQFPFRQSLPIVFLLPVHHLLFRRQSPLLFQKRHAESYLGGEDAVGKTIHNDETAFSAPIEPN